jgi:type II secretory ATPase GspE/PulE/Tfp pilus assembly ATPase PilB-like protein
MSEQVRTLVALRATAREIDQAGASNGMRTLVDDAVELCLEGVTTPAEVRQVAVRTAT